MTSLFKMCPECKELYAYDTTLLYCGKCAPKQWKLLVTFDLKAEAEKAKLESRAACMYQVDALLDAGWKFELPAQNDSEPWQWYWRRPPRRKKSKGMFFYSTNQAYQALKRELMRSLREKTSVADIDLGDKFRDEHGVLMEIVNFNGSTTAVYRQVGATEKTAEREIAVSPVLLASVKKYIVERIEADKKTQ